MNWQKLLFSFDGRINRLPFWLVPIAVSLVTLFLMVLFAIAPMLALIVAVVLFPPMLVGSIAVGVKRLHDRDKSGHWMWLFYLVPAVLDAAGSSRSAGNPGILLSLIAFAISLWGLVEMGFLRGTAGPNRYGPDPLGTD